MEINERICDRCKKLIDLEWYELPITYHYENRGLKIKRKKIIQLCCTCKEVIFDNRIVDEAEE